MARLLEFYNTTVVPELTQKFGYKSRMEVPRITKVTLPVMLIGGWYGMNYERMHEAEARYGYYIADALAAEEDA